MIYGVNRLIEDLRDLGFNELGVIQDNTNVNYAKIASFRIPAGSFADREIDLAIPAPDQYPQICGASIHVKCNPHLVPFGNTGFRNVIASNLGPEWQYWSYQFSPSPINPTSSLIYTINEIFRKN